MQAASLSKRTPTLSCVLNSCAVSVLMYLRARSQDFVVEWLSFSDLELANGLVNIYDNGDG